MRTPAERSPVKGEQVAVKPGGLHRRLLNIASMLDRHECKQDSSNSNCLAHWLTEANAAKGAVNVHAIPGRRVHGIPPVVVPP